MTSWKSASAAIASLVVLPLSYSQFVPAPTDLIETQGHYNQTVRYKEVPEGICELTPGVKSFSGYVDVAPEQSVFWWFFEARNVAPEDAPLTVWINGGPGSSSMVGLFEEIGPCWVDANGELQYQEYAWNNVSNMLFVDHPAQVGFSYANPVPGYVDPDTGSIIGLPNATCPEYLSEIGCGTYSAANVSNTANSTHAAAPSMWKTLQGFMGAFPQYSANGVHFATESYGGHYGPIFNEYFLTQNELVRNDSLPYAEEIDLRSVMIGNGWYDPRIQYEAYYWFAVSPGNTYDLVPFDHTVSAAMYNSLYGPGNCQAQSIDCNIRGNNDVCATADTFCFNNIESLLGSYANRSEYDIRELLPDPFPYGYWKDYLNTAEVQQALGAFVNYTSAGGSTVSAAFSKTGDDVREVGTVAASRFLADEGVYTVHFAGDADYNCNWLGVQAVVDNIDAPGYTAAGFVNISTSDSIVHGQVKQSDNVAFARIYESGHEVPFYQPLVALEMFERVINGLDVATGKKRVSKGEGYKTVGTAKSEYREGNATVQWDVVADGSTYNTTTEMPNLEPGSGNETVVEKRGLGQKSTRMLSRRAGVAQPMAARMGVPRF